MAGRLRLLPAFGIVALALSCTDVGVVGQDSLCPTACLADERCDPTLEVCVRCTPGSDCGNDDAAVCTGNSDDLECVACSDDADCEAGAPFCDDGRCGECKSDDDCAPNAECEDQSCKLSSDEPDKSADPLPAPSVDAGAPVDAAAAVDANMSVDAGDEDDQSGGGGAGSDDP